MHTSPFSENDVAFDLAGYYRNHDALLSKTDVMYMAMADGRASGHFGRREYEAEDPQLVISLGGSLVRVRTGLSGPVTGGLRGDVVGFSSASRRRLMRMIASLERKERPVFVTLTYPDLFVDDMGQWKRDIDVFGKRLARRLPGAGFIWRVEFKERKTGSKAGEIAPHFHLLVYGAGPRSLREWVSEAWFRVVGSGSADHRSAGTRVEKVRSFGGIMRYVGKYMAKAQDWPLGWRGRSWGVVGRSNLPWAVEVVIDLSEDQSIKLVRLGRKMIGAVGRSFNYGVTWIVNAERVLDYLEYLIEIDPP